MRQKPVGLSPFMASPIKSKSVAISITYLNLSMLSSPEKPPRLAGYLPNYRRLISTGGRVHNRSVGLFTPFPSAQHRCVKNAGNGRNQIARESLMLILVYSILRRALSSQLGAYRTLSDSARSFWPNHHYPFRQVSPAYAKLNSPSSM